MINFCTLFDRNYFYKGLSLYSSLLDNCKQDFSLWILCMDDITYDLLLKMNLSHVKLVSLGEFETTKLLAVKKLRSVAEYSWTCASNFIWHLSQKNHDFESLIYLDADLYFYNNPQILLDELGGDDVMITEHRYTKRYDQSAFSGKYCVQFMVFKNNENSLNVLDKWRRDCLEWCFAHPDKGRFGDQKYLDSWTSKFKNIHELQYLGGGVAPWNVQQYNFKVGEQGILIRKKRTSLEYLLVFYHFHNFHLISLRKYFPAQGYYLSAGIRKIVYKEYFKSLKKNIEFVSKYSPDFNFGYKPNSFKQNLISVLSRFDLMILVNRLTKIFK